VPTLDLQVAASTGDCGFWWNGSAWQFATNYDWQQAGWYSSTAAKLGGGMRFQNVTIPQGATITAAYITIYCYTPCNGTVVRTRIIGDDEDNAAAFSTLADFQARRGIIVGGANDNYITSAYVDWDGMAAWSAGVSYNSADISAVIQEIVNRAGWASGNALVLFWDDFNDRSDHNTDCRRIGRPYDGDAANAPKLHIEYTIATAKTSTDTGSGADAYVSLEMGEAKTSSDAGSGVEGTPVPSASLAGSETGSSIDAIIARLLASFDTGYGIEVGSVEVGGLLKELFATELGWGSDSLTAKIEMPTKGGGMKLWT